MSHFLHGCWSNHNWHGDFETQDSSGHVYPAHINKNTWPKPVFFNALICKSLQSKVLRSSLKKLKLQNLTGFWKMHFCFLGESTGPQHQMHSSQTPSLAILPLQLPHTRSHLLSPYLELTVKICLQKSCILIHKPKIFSRQLVHHNKLQAKC